MRLPRFVFPLFLLTFLVGTPTLLLYTAGYSYNFSTHKLEQVGFLLLDGTPKDAYVYISNKLVAQQMPVYLKRAIPDTYSIRIEKEGYVPYETTVSIAPRQSIVYSPLFLLRKEKPLQQRDALGTYLFTDHTNHVAYFSAPYNVREILSLPLDGSVANKNVSFPYDVSKLTPQITDHGALYFDGKRGFVFNFQSQTITPLRENYTDVVYASTGDVYALSKGDLVQVGDRRDILLSKDTPFTSLLTAFPESIIGLTNGLPTAPHIVTEFHNDAYQPVCPTAITNPRINTLGTTSFISSPTHSLVIQESSRKVSCRQFDMEHIATHNSSLIAFDDVSVTYHTQNNEQRPLVRLSTPLSHVTPIPNSPYLVFVSNKQLFVYNSEDTHMKPYVYPFSVTPRILFASPDGSSLYIDGIIDAVDGLFLLPLTDV